MILTLCIIIYAYVLLLNVVFVSILFPIHKPGKDTVLTLIIDNGRNGAAKLSYIYLL